MTTTRILLSSDADRLARALEVYKIVDCDEEGGLIGTVEAEYGDSVVSGSTPELTLGHHGPRSDNPAPCLTPNREGEPLLAIGCGPLDLDCLGGVLALLGGKPEADSFWSLAAFIDDHGAHRLSESGASDEDVAVLHAYYAWSQENRSRTEITQDQPVRDVTGYVEDARQFLDLLLRPVENEIRAERRRRLLDAGEEYRKAGEAINVDSFVQTIGCVAVRISPFFVNKIYTTPDGGPVRGVAGYNTRTGKITLSIARPEEHPGVNCAEIVQGLWPKKDDKGKYLAGGKVGIAGSAYGQRMNLYSLLFAATRFDRVLRGELLNDGSRPCQCGSGQYHATCAAESDFCG